MVKSIVRFFIGTVSKRSSDQANVADDIAGDIGRRKSRPPAVVASVLDSEEMKNRGVVVVHVDGIGKDVRAVFVGSP